jgi:hypothetical protein
VKNNHSSGPQGLSVVCTIKPNENKLKRHTKCGVYKSERAVLAVGVLTVQERAISLEGLLEKRDLVVSDQE